MADEPLTELDYEILGTLMTADETTAIILRDLNIPANADAFSPEAKGLDFDALDAVFARLADLGLVDRKQEATDGFVQPRRGVSFTWWSMTARGVREWEAWAASRQSKP